MSELTRDMLNDYLRKHKAHSVIGAVMAHDAALRARVEALTQEVQRLKTMSIVEMMCENANVDSHVREWEARCLKAEARLAQAEQVTHQ